MFSINWADYIIMGILLLAVCGGAVWWIVALFKAQARAKQQRFDLHRRETRLRLARALDVNMSDKTRG